MKKEKEVCFVHSYKFKGDFYVRVEDFKEIMERVINMRGENEKLKAYKERWMELEEENKKLNLELSKLKEKYGDLDW